MNTLWKRGVDMAIFQLHMIAAEKLSKQVIISNMRDFLIGMTFPDVMWETEISKGSGVFVKRTSKDDITDSLHYATFKNGLRMPNYFEFYYRHQYSFYNSDFLRGYLFHLITDQICNIEWMNHTYENDDKTFEIVDQDIRYSLTCDNKRSLKQHKYSTMLKYAIHEGYDVKLPEKCSTSAFAAAYSMYYVSKEAINKGLRNLHKLEELCDDHPLMVRADFTTKFCEYVVNESINEYMRFNTVYDWHKEIK